MNTASTQRGTTFHWDVRRRLPTVLPAFILISLLVHLATFFAFRVTYPPQATMAAPPPAVTVLDPAPTKAIYFVADGSGGHVFAETFAEHQANVQKWYAIRRQRGEM